MAERFYRLLVLFADGLGLAPAGAGNPLAAGHTPVLSALLGSPLVLERAAGATAGGRSRGPLLRALDASLGVPGLPQSATGQTALFTGVNGARLLGRHVTAYPGPRLRRLIHDRSLFRRARGLGLASTFANAYSERYLEGLEGGTARASVTTCAVRAGGIALRRTADLERGAAVTWDVVGDHFGALSGEAVASVSPRSAGRRLARLAAGHRLTLFETFLTDLAGHGRLGIAPAEALSRLDGLLGGVLEEMTPETTLLLTSDHGNVEERATRSHTSNPVPLLAVGPLAGEFAELGSILDVTPRILAVLPGPRSGTGRSSES